MSFVSKLNPFSSKKSLSVGLKKEVKNLAQRRSGVIRVSEVAVNLNVSREDAQAVLEHFVKRGKASMDVSDRGIITYEFAELLPNSSK